MIKRALVSVSDKTGILDFCRELAAAGIEIVSTGGTAELLQQNEVPVRNVTDLTGFPECLDGRVKTLHPFVHGGILAKRDDPSHQETVESLGLPLIDLVVINLYPFKATIQKPDVSFAECIENIDIGGPAMLRSAAKNHADVTVLIDPKDYDDVLEQIQTCGETDIETRFRLARKVFEHTAAYDAIIADYLRNVAGDDVWPDQLTLTYEKDTELRYGENPHQKAVRYNKALPAKGTMAQAMQLSGKELSYNNIADTDAAIQLLKEFIEPACVAVKHANPCGVAIGENIAEAYNRAYEADPVSIFGGIVAVNREIDAEVAAAMKQIFLEVIIAPGYTDEALMLLMEKKNLRLLRLSDIDTPVAAGTPLFKDISGGLLVQDADTILWDDLDFQRVTEKIATTEQFADFEFAMKVVKHVRSNAIVLARGGQTVGIGPGQPNRITSTEIAIKNAGNKCEGAVLASDAFFPFADCVQAAAKAGIAAIIQPGGSIRDQESIDAANELEVSMYFTGMRHFRH
ncbi:MAG: bifunctional phosphoribosylaminoimidazolecarboxamide formyltransferase/IMP cyclohydrolase [Ruminococcaceae bacterium]|nr:bifunctional phosphoribosylaminoimidazolecarboxamide formyltransferase/IMP cyclohydrolase [Oscillospiraceae bacterium]